MFRLSYLTLLFIGLLIVIPSARASSQELTRAVIADDFTKARPKSVGKRPKNSRTYRRASTPQTGAWVEPNRDKLQLGVTIWKLQPSTEGRYSAAHYLKEQWVSKRVEADSEFREGDRLRISIESPRPGYLYVVDRDSYSDGSSGETNLIFPRRGENNRLAPGKLIDIPAQGKTPFRASPKPNQAGEFLILIVTSSPIPLPAYDDTLPISDSQLTEWRETWSAFAERLEMNDGAGLTRTLAEQQAAAIKGARQLTRNDPGPQTIFLLTPRSNTGFLFNLVLSYAR